MQILSFVSFTDMAAGHVSENDLYLHSGHVSHKVILGAFYCQRDMHSAPKRLSHVSKCPCCIHVTPDNISLSSDYGFE